MKRSALGVDEMTDVLARIESALQRSEAAAARLDRRLSGLRSAASDTISGLDRLIQSEKRKSHG
jgi:hypothetical protein